MTDIPKPLHKIGAVSSLSGVPVPTLRVWQTRYGAFSPAKSGGSHRLYKDEDVLRAGLLRRLTASGHAISTVAHLEASELSALLNRQIRTTDRANRPQSEPRSVSVAAVGLALAERLQSRPFLQGIDGVQLQVTDAGPELAGADLTGLTGLSASPDILIVRVNSLQMAAHTALRRLIDAHAIGQAIVLYSYGQDRVIAALKMAGVIVRREPVTDAELADLVNAVLLVTPHTLSGLAQPGVMIPPRKYSDQTLMQMAGISTNVLCECPRHVAELIGQLASFEQYSQECLNTQSEDAHLHAQLSAISGSARALFERALELVADHEGIVLAQR